MPAPHRSSQRQRVRRSSTALVALAAVTLAACTGEGPPEVEADRVARGEVVETVAAAAELAAASRVEVAAPLDGEVAELHVDDGDTVAAGDLLVTLTSRSLEDRIEEAESSLATARETAASAEGAAVDLSPVVGAIQGQVDAVLTGVLGALEEQVRALEATVTAVTGAVDEAGRTSAASLRELAAELGGRLPPALGVDEELLAAAGPEDPVTVDTGGIEAALAGSRQRLHTAQAEVRAASSELDGLERDLAAQGEATAAAQRAGVDAQLAQAEQALERLRDQRELLAVTAPEDGVVTLARGATAGEPGLGALGELDGVSGLGALGDGGGGVPDGLLDGFSADGGAAGGGGAGGAAATIAVGRSVGPGQLLLTIHDLSGFTVEADVDELDVLDVAAGQPVEVLVDAAADQELTGVVDRVALEPIRGAGGARYPVSVQLDAVPADLRLLPGLTAAVEIEVARFDDELVVPSSALLRHGSDEVVFRIRDADQDDGSAVETVPVTVLAFGDGTAAVAGDLAPGDQVVTTGVELLADGDQVRVVSSAASR